MGWAKESIKSYNLFREEDREYKRFRGNRSSSPGIARDLSLPVYYIIRLKIISSLLYR